ncbi:thiamine phosphate synthase [Sphingomonas sp. AX6]|uniref:thiamine phosphate synthase n=1 Tax=Sphingomonas sp. AX6 TaxID=2653171 RepID=UPI0012F0394D|nr:thiamine phosphate synthase [Sphingomonas sp. AX6]VXC49064.1 Thiamine phosphate synthase [Sphingomonas sp. AX6]
MRRRHPLPRIWLMTDERMGDALWRAINRLPRGAGVVFRHYSLPLPERRTLFARVSVQARRRGLVLIVAGRDWLGRADGTHNGSKRQGGLRTWSVHSRCELVEARRRGADLIFISPVYATRSHYGARALGRLRLGLLIRGNTIPVVALGGMTASRFQTLRGLSLHGWAGIDAFL